jgi:8-oxo-dGTP diphosphatase
MKNKKFENWYKSVKQDFSLSQKLVLTNEKKEILLLKAVMDELWDLPGGHFEKDDLSLRQSLKREVSEEIGQSVQYEILQEISVNLRTYQGEFKNIKISYLANYIDGDIQLSEEHSQFKWFNLAELENLIKAKEWVNEVLQKAKKLL